MQEVTSAETATSTIFDQLRTNAVVDTSSRSRAFSDFMGLMSQSGSRQSAQFQAAQSAPNQIDPGFDVAAAQNAALVQNAALAEGAPVQAVAATAAAVAPAYSTAANAAGTTVGSVASQLKQGGEAVSSAARNAPVSREAFEETKPLLLKAGFSDKDISELAARVQAGTLTWGQLIQNIGSHMTGAKKAVSLSASEGADLQSLFQKMGFAANASAQMVQSVAKGDGLKVLASIQNKLSTMPEDTTLGMDKNELAAFFKAMRVPAATAEKLTQTLNENSTVADMKAALATMGQALKDQHAKTAAGDAELAKSIGKIMEKDTAKHARDTVDATGQAVSSSSGPQVAYELKTKGKDDTSWFDQREQAQQQKTQQQKASDEAWKGFNSKVRADETVLQSSPSGQQLSQAAAQAAGKDAGGKDALESLTRAAAGATTGSAAGALNAQQGKAEAAQQTRAFDKVVAPKVLDQVSEAMLKDLGQGRKQLTVQLDPENLGKVQLVLQVKGKEVSALIQAEDAQTAAMLTSNMESLKKTLQDQGLTVQNLEVQTGLASRQDQQQAFNADQHNQAQEKQDLSRIFSQLKMLRDDGVDVASDMQNMRMQAILADQGLHIIA
ncbi:MAG: flagellar hook-length control protein FliK [Desulfovibrio sp.]|jgi:flagellar hook-length control protein FliK|nr:flagellar hook-length control protein FliK [Desulfovibrio sp.]